MIEDSRAIRIAFVSHKFQRNDGQGRVNYEVVKAALARGYKVTVLATKCADDIANHPNGRFIQMGNDNLPTALLRVLFFASLSARWLRKHRGEFDITQSNGFVTWEDCDISAAHFVHTSWKRSQYFPFRNLSPYSLYQRLLARLNSGWEIRVFTRAKRVIAVSKHIGTELERIGVRPDRIDVIYNGVDTTEFHPGETDRHAFRLPEGVPLALFVGDIKTPRKNLETVLKALQSLPTLHLAVAGAVKGSPYPAMTRDLGLGDRVIFMDKVSGISKLMRSVDMFLFPTRYEAHPLVVLEAMASGLPMIVSGVFGAEDFLGGGGLILQDPNDVQGLATLINKLLADVPLRMSLGKAGRLRALQMQWSMMAEHYLEVYGRFLQDVGEIDVGSLQGSDVLRSKQKQ